MAEFGRMQVIGECDESCLGVEFCASLFPALLANSIPITSFPNESSKLSIPYDQCLLSLKTLISIILFFFSSSSNTFFVLSLLLGFLFSLAPISIKVLSPRLHQNKFLPVEYCEVLLECY